MRRVAVGILFVVLLGPALAADPSDASAAEAKPAVLEMLPGKQGYAFEQPEILIRQRLFGLAHGVSLLAAACLDLPEYSGLIQDAYASWHAKQAAAIETLVLDLARYYYGARAGKAGWQDLVRALNLKDNIQVSLGQISLQEACASLPVAIIRPRYEFDKLLLLGAKTEADEAGTGAAMSARSEDPGTQIAPGSSSPESAK